MAGRGDREELGQALDDPEEQRPEQELQIHCASLWQPDAAAAAVRSRAAINYYARTAAPRQSSRRPSAVRPSVRYLGANP